MHERNVFVTLTYRDDALPPGGSLRKKDFQDFMKRLRFHTGEKIRYFHCGEYGDKGARPHYHALLFGIDFTDKVKHSKNAQGDYLYTSKKLEEIWGHGHCLIGAVTFETAAYTARYITKKISGDMAEKHYESIDVSTGEIIQRQPEYASMSLKPGIGIPFYEKYRGDVFPSDFVVLRGKEMRPPKAYDRKLETETEELYKKIKRDRIRSASKHKADQTPERLVVRREVKLAKLSTLKRTL